MEVFGDLQPGDKVPIRGRRRNEGGIRLMAHTQPSAMTQHAESFAASFHGVRYQVRDVLRSIDFYANQLGFKVEHQQPPAFANISLGPLHLFLSGPGASGSRLMPGGHRQEPGGWNRVVLHVPDLSAHSA